MKITSRDCGPLRLCSFFVVILICFIFVLISIHICFCSYYFPNVILTSIAASVSFYIGLSFQFLFLFLLLFCYVFLKDFSPASVYAWWPNNFDSFLNKNLLIHNVSVDVVRKFESDKEILLKLRLSWSFSQWSGSL